MMKKLISGLVLLAMLACLVLPAAAAEPTALPMTVAEAVDGVSAYCTAAMIVLSSKFLTSHWMAIAILVGWVPV